MRRVPEGGGVLVATSGGADSTALAVLAVAVAPRGGWAVTLGTVDHGLRIDSALDAAFVQELGEWLGVPVLTSRVSVRGGEGLAAAARDARYAALTRMTVARGASAVLVAHHAEDQLETVLMRLVRGSGPRAAGGMPAVRRLQGGVRVIRPLLERSRGELRGLLQRCGVAWREDPGNALQSGPRGRLRHRVLVELETMAPGAAVRASRAARRVRGAAAALRRQAAALMQDDGPWNREALRAAPSAVLAEALRRRWPEANEEQVEACVRAMRRRDTRSRRCRLGSGTLEIGACRVLSSCRD